MSRSSPQANCLRMLAIDAVQKARSGHPGMPMGMADIAATLWMDFLKHNPCHPNWINRDRFVLSNGHGSMLQYALLHLTGYDVSIDDLKSFRTLHSKTPGHPEWGMTPGVETTTGPLGQGLANAVGMALAEKMLAAQFNRPGYDIIDHYTYVFAGDGCLMEGVSHEACAFAGTHELSKLIVFYDDNGISIDGEVSPWFSEHVAGRFQAYHWHVLDAVDGHDPKAIHAAIVAAKNDPRPSLIACKTTIGWGSPNLAGSEKSHGAPLGDDEIAQVRETLAWPHAPFEVPDVVYALWDAKLKGQDEEAAWQAKWLDYQQAFPDLSSDLSRRMAGQLPASWGDMAEKWLKNAENCPDMATRQSSLAWLNQAAKDVPELLGGSADLSGSNGTLWQGAVPVTAEQPRGRYLRYGVREFGMTAMMNGLALHGGFIPYGGTFLVFSDYARNAVRLAALMGIRVIMVYTHDSVALGEDGPTHQPIEHLASLRTIPKLMVWRPADAVEVAAAWIEAMSYQGPSALVLSRQTVPTLKHADTSEVALGGYTIYGDAESSDIALIATGSEVSLAIEAAKQLQQQSRPVHVVSMPCVKRFLSQPLAYQRQVLPESGCVRLAIEAGVSDTWWRFVSHPSHIIGIDEFGVSATGEAAMAHFGFSVSHLVDRVNQVCENQLSLNEQE